MSRRARDGWEGVWHPERKLHYYQNPRLGISTWKRPAGYDGDLPPPSAADEAPRPARPEDVPPGWSVAFDPRHGLWYYFNAKTGERSWTYPEVVEEIPDRIPSKDSGFGGASTVRPDSGVRKAGESRQAFMIRQIWDAPSFRIRLHEAQGKPQHLCHVLTDIVASNAGLLEEAARVTKVRVWASQSLVYKIVFHREDGVDKAFGRPGGSEQKPFLIPSGDSLVRIVSECGEVSHIGCCFETLKGGTSEWYGGHGGESRRLEARTRHHLTGLVMKQGAATELPVGIVENYLTEAAVNGELAKASKRYTLGLAVPPTARATLGALRDIEAGLSDGPAAVSVSTRSWLAVMAELGQEDEVGGSIVLLNYVADPSRPWGGYLHGDSDPEAELCRHVPALYDSLKISVQEEQTAAPGADPEVCLTRAAAAASRGLKAGSAEDNYQGLVLVRGEEESGLPVMVPDRHVNLEVVTAACPIKDVMMNTPSSHQHQEIAAVIDSTVEAIFLAPRLRVGPLGRADPKATTLVISPLALCRQAQELVDQHTGVDLCELVAEVLTQAVAPGSPLARLHAEVCFLLGRSPGTERDPVFERNFKDALTAAGVEYEKR